MCNLSQGIVDRVTAEVTAEVTAKNLIDFIMNMYDNKFSLEQISLATKKSVDEVKKIIEEQEAVLVQIKENRTKRNVRVWKPHISRLLFYRLKCHKNFLLLTQTYHMQQLPTKKICIAPGIFYLHIIPQAY